MTIEEHPPAIEGQSGNETTYRAALICHDNGVSKEKALELLEEYNKRCEPPWQFDELVTFVNNAYRYGKNALGAKNPKSDFEVIEGPSDAVTELGEGCQDCQFQNLKPLPLERPPVPSMSPDFIPEQLRPWLVETAHQLCVPLEYVAVPAIVAAGAAIGKKIAIMPRGREDWLVYPNLWGAIVGPPSAKKTPCLESMLSPLKKIGDDEFRKFSEAKQRDDMEREEVKQDIKRLEQAIKDLEKDKKKGMGTEPKERLKVLKLRLEKAKARLLETQPILRRFIVNDTTPEKLGEILRDNPDGVLIHRDELYGQIEACRKKGFEGYRELMLEGFNARGSYTVDRIGRGTVHIPSLCLSIVGGVQPAKFAALVRSATNGGIGEDGLLQRFQLAVWPDDFPPFKLANSSLPREELSKVERLFRRMAGYGFDYAAQFPTVESSEIHAISLDPQIQGLFDIYVVEIEKTVRSDDLKERPALAAHLGKFTSLVAKLALIFHMIEFESDTENKRLHVSGNALNLALKWGGFLRLHAEKVYFNETKPEVRPATLLAKKIINGQVVDGIHLRDIRRSQWSGLTTQDDIERGLALLESCGWIRIEVKRTQGGPSRVVRVNPLAVSSGLE